MLLKQVIRRGENEIVIHHNNIKGKLYGSIIFVTESEGRYVIAVYKYFNHSYRRKRNGFFGEEYRLNNKLFGIHLDITTGDYQERFCNIKHGITKFYDLGYPMRYNYIHDSIDI